MVNGLSEKNKTLVQAKSWWVYIIQASNGNLYTGITTNVARRWREHCAVNSSDAKAKAKGAKFFRGNKPKQLMYVESCIDRSVASKREAAIKKLTRQTKLALLNDSCNELTPELAAECQQA